MLFVCILQAAEPDVFNLFLRGRFFDVGDEGRLRSNEGVLVPLSCKMKARNFQQGLLRLINDCKFDPVEAVFEFARAHEIYWAVLEALGWHLYDFASAMIVAVPEWNADCCRRGHRGKVLPGTVYSEAVPRYFEEF